MASNSLLLSGHSIESKMQDSVSLRIVVKGLSKTERRLLSATVKLSQRRQPHLELISDNLLNVADIVIIDSADSAALAWANEYEAQLNDKSVIWIDAKAGRQNHSSLSRPVMWVNLPIIISRILDEISVLNTAPVAQPNAQLVEGAGNDALDILVVDDSPSIRQHLTSLLQASGHQIIAVDCGEAALDVVNQRGFDCVFMDILMPGIDGYEACKKIKSKKINGKTLPVIMLTGKSSPFDRIRGKMAGCDAYLTKPVAVEKLKRTLEKVVSLAKRG